MIVFFEALGDELSDLFNAGELGVLITAIIAVLLYSVSAGIVGTYVVTRRITYLSGGISHCVLGGIGVAIYCREIFGWSGVEPITGAFVAAITAAMITGYVSLKYKEREDTIISALWVLGMGGGILLIAQVPGYKQDLIGYLFGDIVMVTSRDLIATFFLDIVIVIFVFVFYRRMLAVCFDEEFAATRGIRVELYYMLLLVMTAVTVVFMVSLVGIVMVIAMLTIPAAIASRCFRKIWSVMLLSISLCAIFSFLGIAISYGPGLPSGATIVVLSAGAYLFFLIAQRFVLLVSKRKTRA